MKKMMMFGMMLITTNALAISLPKTHKLVLTGNLAAELSAQATVHTEAGGGTFIGPCAEFDLEQISNPIDKFETFQCTVGEEGQYNLKVKYKTGGYCDYELRNIWVSFVKRMTNKPYAEHAGFELWITENDRPDIRNLEELGTITCKTDSQYKKFACFDSKGEYFDTVEAPNFIRGMTTYNLSVEFDD